MSDISMIIMYTTVASTDQANELAKNVIESKLAVCVNVMSPHQAIYLEQNTLKNVTEIGLLIKIIEDNYEFAYEAIKSWHPYEIPAILSWPVEANQAYSVWAYQQTHAII
jgi:periplasmic divalent cation tolerance protein